MSDIDWTCWQPRVWAVVCYLRKEGKILLIHRRSGMAQNKISAPGGKMEPGEQPAAAAIREIAEEVHLQVEERDLELVGRLHFQFTDGYSMLGYVYLVHAFTGEAGASREAEPFWVDQDKLPLAQMWADDPLWLPYVLDGGKMSGYFLLHCDNMVHQSEVHEQLLSYRIEWGVCPAVGSDEGPPKKLRKGCKKAND